MESGSKNTLSTGVRVRCGSYLGLCFFVFFAGRAQRNKRFRTGMFFPPRFEIRKTFRFGTSSWVDVYIIYLFDSIGYIHEPTHSAAAWVIYPIWTNINNKYFCAQQALPPITQSPELIKPGPNQRLVFVLYIWSFAFFSSRAFFNSGTHSTSDPLAECSFIMVLSICIYIFLFYFREKNLLWCHSNPWFPLFVYTGIDYCRRGKDPEL